MIHKQTTEIKFNDNSKTTLFLQKKHSIRSNRHNQNLADMKQGTTKPLNLQVHADTLKLTLVNNVLSICRT